MEKYVLGGVPNDLKRFVQNLRLELNAALTCE